MRRKHIVKNYSENYKKSQVISCIICGKKHKAYHANIKRGKGKYCSKECWLKDASRRMIGEKNILWKGDKVKYHSLHKWIDFHKEKTNRCSICRKNKKTVWANKDNSYKRNTDDYIELCQKCHLKYDMLFNNYGNFRSSKPNRKDNTSGIRGVSWSKNKKKWVIRVQFLSKVIIKYSKNKMEAFKIRQKIANKLFLATIDKFRK